MLAAVLLLQLAAVPDSGHLHLIEAEGLSASAGEVRAAADPWAGSFRTREWVLGGVATAITDAAVVAVGTAAFEVGFFALMLRAPVVMLAAVAVFGLVAAFDLFVSPLLATLVESRVAGAGKAGSFKQGLVLAYLTQLLAAAAGAGLIAAGKNTAVFGALSWFALHNAAMPLAASYGLHHGAQAGAPTDGGSSSAALTFHF